MASFGILSSIKQVSRSTSSLLSEHLTLYLRLRKFSFVPLANGMDYLSIRFVLSG